jgi:hypothetical protein
MGMPGRLHKHKGAFVVAGLGLPLTTVTPAIFKGKMHFQQISVIGLTNRPTHLEWAGESHKIRKMDKQMDIEVFFDKIVANFGNFILELIMLLTAPLIRLFDLLSNVGLVVCAIAFLVGILMTFDIISEPPTSYKGQPFAAGISREAVIIGGVLFIAGLYIKNAS